MIVQLPKAELNITWRHTRFGHMPQSVLTSQGSTVKVSGRTTCLIEKKTAKTEKMVTGLAHCSVHDNFSYAKGREVSLARAMRALKLNKKQRKVIWHQLPSVQKRMNGV